LGIYAILKKYGKQVEVVNADRSIPRNLNFLPNFSKITHQIDYDNSLIIACDAGSLDRLGFELGGRDILNIDHHKSNTNYGMVNIVRPDCVSATQVAFEIFGEEFEIDRESATCFYTGLVTGTQYFKTNNVTKEVFDVASDMIAYGIDIAKVAYHINQQKSLTSLRILSSALQSLELHLDGALATMIITKEQMHSMGAIYNDLQGIVDYGISLVTVEIAVVMVELDGIVHSSMRSKSVDISSLAVGFSGGGHKNAAGFEQAGIRAEELLAMVINKIKNGIIK
jgi:phosphoesterase RecJ-like protein